MFPDEIWWKILDSYTKGVWTRICYRICIRVRLVCRSFAAHNHLQCLAHVYTPAPKFVALMNISSRFHDLSVPRETHRRTISTMLTHRFKVQPDIARHLVTLMYQTVMEEAKHTLCKLSSPTLKIEFVDFVLHAMTPLALRKQGNSGLPKMKMDLDHLLQNSIA